jgi:hypothetical protein
VTATGWANNPESFRTADAGSFKCEPAAQNNCGYLPHEQVSRFVHYWLDRKIHSQVRRKIEAGLSLQRREDDARADNDPTLTVEATSYCLLNQKERQLSHAKSGPRHNGNAQRECAVRSTGLGLLRRERTRTGSREPRFQLQPLL